MLPEISCDERQWTLPRGRRVNRIHGHHARLHVILHVAMKHPRARVIGEHVHSLHASRKEFNHIRVSSAFSYSFAMPMGSVQVDLVPHTEQVPAHPFSLLCIQTGEIAENESIDRIEQARRLPCHLVENHEGSNKLSINVLGRSVWICLALRRNDDGSEQSGVDLDAWINVGVIPPHD